MSMSIGSPISHAMSGGAHHQMMRDANGSSPVTALVHGSRSPVDDATTQLQRRLVQESSERDGVKLTLTRLKSTVDFYRQRLLALVLPVPPGVGAPSDDGSAQQRAHRVRDLVREMEVEARTSAEGGAIRGEMSPTPVTPTSPNKGSNYEVLRHSLQEMQRRCESLNTDMVYQAEANDELVETLSTVKDANKHLLEQIRVQTAEISQLTQQRVEDEARMDQMMRKHESDREAIRQETQRQVLVTRELGAERHNTVYQQLTDKLRYVRTRGEILRQDVSRLQRELQERQGDMNNLVSSMQSQLQSAERDLSNQCSAPAKLHGQRKISAEDSIGDLQVRLQAEKDARQNEGLAWSHKHGAVATEKDAIASRLTRDVAQLSAQLQAADRLVTSERQSWAEERTTLERTADDYMRQRTQRKGTLDQLQRDIISLETSISAATSEIAGLEQATVELRRQGRECDDALAAAVSSNEHLREQMEEHRARFQAKNEADLSECRNGYEQKLNDMRLAAEADAALTQKQLEAMDADSKAQAEELDKLSKDLEVVTNDCASGRRDGSMWRSQFEVAQSGREATEKELVDERQVFVFERLKMQAGIDQHSNSIGVLDEECRQTAGEIQELRRESVTRETEAATKQSAAESKVKELQDNLAEAKGRLFEVMDNAGRASNEAHAIRERGVEMQNSLELALRDKANYREEERRRMDEAFHSEKRAAEQVRSQFQQQHDSLSNQIRRVHDESRNKLAGAERQRAVIEETCRTEIQKESQAIMMWQRKIELLERELTRARNMLAESESNHSWVMQERNQEERESVLRTRQVEDDVRMLASQLDAARRDDTSLSQQVAQQTNRNEQDRVQLRRSLDGAGGKAAAMLASTSPRKHPLTAR
mmetsp:Transcript_134918/g.248028  ORF Transcript_134918/g.248028 Transcript_134918/m.248028 type:complete len:881 (-) Transcript_134918:106-2748(-)